MRWASKLVIGVSATAAALTFLVHSQTAPDGPSKAPAPTFNKALLSEERPLLFVRNYVGTIQGEASRNDYEAFLHPDLLQNAAKMPEVFDQLFMNALSENAVLSRSNVLTSSVRIEQSESGRATVFFQLPKSLPLKDVYPHSPFVGQGYTSDSGQINLAQFDGQWRIVGHAFEAVQDDTSAKQALNFKNGMQ